MSAIDFRVKRAKTESPDAQESHSASSQQKLLSEMIKSLKTSLDEDVAKMEAERSERQRLNAKFKTLKVEDITTVKTEISELAKKLSPFERNELYLDFASALEGALRRENNVSIYREFSDCLKNITSLYGNPSLMGKLEDVCGNMSLTASVYFKGDDRIACQMKALKYINSAIKNYQIADRTQRLGLMRKHQDDIQRLSVENFHLVRKLRGL